MRERRPSPWAYWDPMGKRYRPNPEAVPTMTGVVCDGCGGEMRVKINGETGEAFLGCGNYPDCTVTQPIPTSLRLRLMGAPTLPGF